MEHSHSTGRSLFECRCNGNGGIDFWSGLETINPNKSTIYATLGELYRERQEYELAVQAFQRACELDPGLSAARRGLGLTLIHLGRLWEGCKSTGKDDFRWSPNLNTLFALASLPGHLVNLDLVATATGQARALSGPKQDAKIRFIRAAALNQRQSYTEAWSDFTEANRIMFRETDAAWKRQREHDLDLLERIKSSAVVPPPVSDIQRENPMPLFFLGPPRSGKTTAELLVSTITGVKRGFESFIVENSVRHSFQGAALPPHEQLTDIPSGLENAFQPQFSGKLCAVQLKEAQSLQLRIHGASRCNETCHPFQLPQIRNGRKRR